MDRAGISAAPWMRTIWAGIPATVQRAGTALRTTLPAATLLNSPISMFPTCWIASGLSYPDLISDLLDAALPKA